MEKKKMIRQLLFIKFPIIFPIIYGFILYTFPEYEKELIIITLLLLAETHFAATWPFFLAKSNIDHIKKDPLKLIFFPISITLFSIIGFFLFKSLFLMIFFMANVYHVTRQSFGVCKLYCKDNLEIKFQENYIYIFNFIFFIVAFLRFYMPVINEDNIITLNIIILVLFVLVFITYIFRFGFNQNFLTFVTGVIIFYPTCFVTNPVHAIIMGVTMHYTQYLYLTKYVVTERNKEQVSRTKRNIFNNYFFIIIIYSIIMTSFSFFGNNSNINLNSLILIPIIGQMLHFYLDSQLWKFSFPHNRENVLKYILRFIK
ncbi:hypothetical protein OA180_00105 [Candidatus Pelagibacter sp.]|nr:hypothetical protein [Candidatus Pelagibacter sp.]